MLHYRITRGILSLKDVNGDWILAAQMSVLCNGNSRITQSAKKCSGRIAMMQVVSETFERDLAGARNHKRR